MFLLLSEVFMIKNINFFSEVFKIFISVIDDITKAVPGLKLKRSYGKSKCFMPIAYDVLDFAIPSHMLEIYDFPKSVRTGDLLNVSFIFFDFI